MTCLYVIAYDIVDDRRRARVARVLQGYGVRAQESVFECWLEEHRLRALVPRLRRELDAVEDKLRIYPLCGRDARDITQIGRPVHSADQDAAIV